MIATYYTIIIVFFVIGALGIYFANRKRNKKSKKQNWTKYGVYFLITNVLFLVIFFIPELFPYVCLLISTWGAFEIVHLQMNDSRLKRISFCLLIGIYLIFSWLFVLFGTLEFKTILYTVFTVLIFDAFCQISGQVFGKTSIFPTISPNKTTEGLTGGTIITLVASAFLGQITGLPFHQSLFLTVGICFFALTGDLSASRIKRFYSVKDFGSSLSGHGGFLDRFDCLIPAGSFSYLFFYLIK